MNNIKNALRKYSTLNVAICITIVLIGQQWALKSCRIIKCLIICLLNVNQYKLVYLIWIKG